MKKFIPISILLIFLWGAALRAPEVINGNYLFGFDQGRDYLAAYNIAQLGKPTLIGSEVGAGAAGINGVFHGPGYYYLLALVYKIFRGDPYGGLFLMFLFGVATLVMSYLTAKKMFGEKAAVMALFLVGISPLIVSQSRFLWNHHPSSFFIVLSLYFAYMIAKKHRLYAPLAIFTAGFIYHFELAIAVPMVMTMFISLPLVYRVKDIKSYVYSLLAALAAFSPFLLFEWRHGWQALRAISAYLSSGTGQVTFHFQNYLDNARNSFIYGNGYVGERVFNVLALSVFVALVWFASRGKNSTQRKFFQFLLLLVSVSYVLFIFLNNQIWDYYLIHAHFVYIYVFAYWFAYKRGRTFLLFFLVLMLWSTVNRMITNIRFDLWDAGGVAKIQGKKAAIDYVYQDAGGKEFSEFTFMPPIYTYPYDYLFLTYGKQTYGYVPGTGKKGLVYLIIEPDDAKPWTYKGWLETVIAGGEIIDSVTLPTGHVIQKRQFIQ